MNNYVFLLILLSVFALTRAKTFDDKQGTKILLVSGRGYDFNTASEVIDLEGDIGDDCNGLTEFLPALVHLLILLPTEGTF